MEIAEQSLSRCAEEFGSLFGSHNPGDIPSSIQSRLSAQGWCILLILDIPSLIQSRLSAQGWFILLILEIFHLQYNPGYQLKVGVFY